MRKVNSFVNQFVAMVKGDDVQVEAEKAWRNAESALKVQIASKEGDTIRFEDAVSEAQEVLNKARVNNGAMIHDRDAYIRNLVEAKNHLTDAEENLEFHLKTLNFLREEYENLQKME